MAKLQKTSLQLPPTILEEMGRWTGLTRSEALRLSIERGQYLSCLNLENRNVVHIVEEYAPILREALEDLNYEDYRLAARSLPQIVAGFFCEVLGEHSVGRSWRSELDNQILSEKELVSKLEALNTLERIGILDCIVSQRYLAERQRKYDESLQAANAVPIKN